MLFDGFDDHLLLVHRNQAARGSRVLFLFGMLLTLLGGVGVSVTLLKGGDVSYFLSSLFWGVPILYCTLRKSSREYRLHARSKKSPVPKMLLFSILGLVGFFVFYMIRDVLNLIETNRSIALQLAWMCPLGIVTYIMPILWGLKWGDKATFNLYRFIIICVAAYVIGGFFASFSDPSFIRMNINIFLSVLFMIPAILVFLPSVRKWARGLKPAF